MADGAVHEIHPERERYRPHTEDLKEVKMPREPAEGGWLVPAAGAGLALIGLLRGRRSGALLAAAGTAAICRELARRGWPARRSRALRGDFGRRKVATQDAIKVHGNVTVNRERETVYRFWRQLENLPRIMSHVQSVTEVSPTRSHWIMVVPLGPGWTEVRLEWNADIINEKEGELIGWRSIAGSDIDHAGSVQFTEVADPPGTDVAVTLQYRVPGGLLGALVGHLLGPDPEETLRQDLLRFKRIMEEGDLKRGDG